MRFSHLALPVSDVSVSWAFYRDVLGIEGTVRKVEDSLLITRSDGFVLAFLKDEATPGDGRLHFGFAKDSGDDVRELRASLQAHGVNETDWIEMDGFVSMKFEDPDGYVIEIFWEQS